MIKAELTAKEIKTSNISKDMNVRFPRKGQKVVISRPKSFKYCLIEIIHSDKKNEKKETVYDVIFKESHEIGLTAQ